MFVQDDWRVNSRLTLNFGMRLEHETGPADANNRFVSGFDPAAASPLQATVAEPKIRGALLYAGVNGNPTHALNPLAVKLGPRFGFAYSASPKMSVRGGYGIFWAPLPFNFQSALGYSQSTPIITSVDNNFTPVGSLDNPYPAGLLQPVGNAAGGLAGIGQAITAYDRNARSAGYVQQYSFDVQRQLGSLGDLLGFHRIAGRAPGAERPQHRSARSRVPAARRRAESECGQPAVQQWRRAEPRECDDLPLATDAAFPAVQFGDDQQLGYRPFAIRLVLREGAAALRERTDDARHLHLVAQHGHGLRDDGEFLQHHGQRAAESYNLRDEYGLSAQNTPHRFSMAVTYELPFRSANRALHYVAAGWSVNVVSVLQSGYPLSITQPNNNSVIGASYQRPNATGLSPEVSGTFGQRIDGWINPAAFSLAPQFTFGNVSRTNALRGPGQTSWDVSVFKTFAIYERFKAQFRAESLNVTNTPVFYGPNTTYTNPQFGVITSQANYPRLIQLGVRFFL